MSTSPITVSVPTKEMRTALGDLGADVTVVEWDMSGAPPTYDIDIVVPPYLSAPSVLRQLSGVKARLVQSQSIGYDGVRDHLPAGLTFANARSVHETSTAELVVALILGSQRGLPDFVRDGAEGRWAPSWRDSLADRTVLLVGYGGVGRAIESRLQGFEVTIERIASSERHDERGVIHGFDALGELLPLADIVVVVVPLTPATRGLIDDTFLSRMRDGSLLVNVSRGPVADSDALIAHATNGRLRLALDVTDPEPLPAGHPLFALSNVLISPHVGGMTSAMLPRMARLLSDQIARMQRGDDPINVVQLD